MAKDPEQVLPQHRIAAPCGIEERPVEGPLQLEQQVAGDQRREGEQDHPRHDQHIPGIKRHQVDAHPRRAALQHAHDQLHRRRDGGDLDEAQPQQPDVDADAFVQGGQRRIHEPATARAAVEQHRAHHEDAANQEAPVAVGRQARERHVARAQEGGQHKDADRLEHRHREQEHHGRAMHGEELVEPVRIKELVVRHRQLHPHQQRKHARTQHEEQRRQRIPGTHLVVVHGGPVGKPLRLHPGAAQPRLVRLLLGRIDGFVQHRLGRRPDAFRLRAVGAGVSHFRPFRYVASASRSASFIAS